MVEQSDAYYVLDTSRARELLDWSPDHALREMLPKIVEALKTDPTGWYKANKLNPELVAWYGHSPARRLDEATPDPHQRDSADRTSVVSGTRVSVRVARGGRRIITKIRHKHTYNSRNQQKNNTY